MNDEKEETDKAIASLPVAIATAIDLVPGKVYLIELAATRVSEAFARHLHHMLEREGIRPVIVLTEDGKTIRVIRPEEKDHASI